MIHMLMMIPLKIKLLLCAMVACVTGLMVLMNFGFFLNEEEPAREPSEQTAVGILQTYDQQTRLGAESVVWTCAPALMAHTMTENHQIDFTTDTQEQAFTILRDPTVVDIAKDVPPDGVSLTEGVYSDTLLDKIRRQIGQDALEAIDLEQSGGPDLYVLVAQFLQHLTYQYPFGKLAPMRFRGHLVKCFGISKFDARSRIDQERASQVQVVDYRSADNFILLLDAVDHPETIILAKVPPADTLDATIDGVLHRISAHPKGRMTHESKLWIPYLSAQVMHDFEEFEGLNVDGVPILLWRQLDRFELNEKEVACLSRDKCLHN